MKHSRKFYQVTRSALCLLTAVALLLAGSPGAQAAVPGNENWAAATGSFDGAIYAAIYDSSGNLYVGGAFTTPYNRIAMWNGSVWSDVATGGITNGTVYALGFYNNELYVGGSFTDQGDTNGDNLVRLNGSSWASLGTGVIGTVYASAASGGYLYVGGSITNAGGTAVSNIARWNGSAWSALGTGVNNTVWALAPGSGDNLYVGGSFTNGSGVNARRRVALWNGSAWSGTGFPNNGTVYALSYDGDTGRLYAGGSFTFTGSNNMIYYNGSSWSAVGSGLGSEVRVLAWDSARNLHAGGSFTTPGSLIALWDGTSWNAMGGGVSAGTEVQALAFDGNGRLYVGGLFSAVGSGLAAVDLAVWTAAVGISGFSAGNDYTFYVGDMPVVIHITTLGDIQRINIQRFNTNHPNASGNQLTGYYWSIQALTAAGAPASGYTVNLTLPMSGADSYDKLCRYNTGTSSWECNRSSNTATAVTLDGVTAFSDWTLENNGPTAVTMAGLEARPQPNGLRVEWATALELDVYGFDVYRSTGLFDTPLKLNAELIPAKALGGLGGANYVYLDQTAVPGVTYYYWIEVQQVEGPERFGPQAATMSHWRYLPLVRR